MNITEFLNESININEDKVANTAYKKVSKYLLKETKGMNITEFLNESININEDKVANTAYKKVSKYLLKETKGMTSQGFGGFGKESKAIFVEYHRNLLFECLREVNFSELIKLNDGLGKKYLKTKLSTKLQRFLDVRLLDSEYLLEYARKITELCKWDVITLSKVMTMFYESQGFRDMKVLDGVEGVDEKLLKSLIK